MKANVKILLLISAAAVACAPQSPPAKQPATEPPEQPGGGFTDTPQLPGQKWKVHDAARPKPRKVTPGLPVLAETAPSDGTVLFAGKDLSQWVQISRNRTEEVPRWKVENGYMEIVPGTGDLVTKEKFGDCQLHVEWMIPAGTPGTGQEHGNSGVELMGRYEIQVLESYQNLTYADGQAAAMYGQWPPLVNASRPEGEWNVYDIFFEAPRFEGDKVVKPAYLTLLHNGVLVHNHQEFLGATTYRRVAAYRPHAPEESLSLQGSEPHQIVRYRNIWIRRLRPYDEP